MSKNDAVSLNSGNDWSDYLALEELLGTDPNDFNEDGKLGFTYYSIVTAIPTYWYTNNDPGQGFSNEYTSIVNNNGAEEFLQESQITTLEYYLDEQPEDKFRTSFSDVTELKFAEQSSSVDPIGEIFLWNSDVSASGDLAKAASPSGTERSGDIVFDNDGDSITPGDREFVNYSQQEIGEPGAFVILHELAHAIGLRHTTEAGLTGQQGTQKYSIMTLTYNDSSELHGDMSHTSNLILPKGLQLYDIYALQQVYGTNTDTRNENAGFDDGDSNTTGTTYKLGTGQAFGETANDAFIYTIWDGGGDTDVIDATGYNDGVQIDLREGYFSSIGKNGDTSGSRVRWDAEAVSQGETAGYDAGNVAIAYGTIIENAIGTSHDDSLIGNDANNLLEGSEGADNLDGGDGRDTADYSNDAGNGGTGDITATMNANGTATVVDG